jgi:hypothetical protein
LNHQISRIIAESPLLEVYKNTRIQFEQMFCLDHKTTRHSPPKMELTFKRLGDYMRKEMTNEEVKGRDGITIIDAMSVGMHNAMSGKIAGDSDGDDIEIADEMEEVEDDGSLDV